MRDKLPRTVPFVHVVVSVAVTVGAPEPVVGPITTSLVVAVLLYVGALSLVVMTVCPARTFAIEKIKMTKQVVTTERIGNALNIGFIGLPFSSSGFGYMFFCRETLELIGSTSNRDDLRKKDWD